MTGINTKCNPGSGFTLDRGQVSAIRKSRALAWLMDYLPFPGETQFLSFITANYREWFPHWLDQSQFNRRLRTLDGVLEQLRRFWVEQLGVGEENSFVLDTKPIPVIGLKRNKRNSDFSGSATPGWCAARQMHYFGYKLVVLATWQGVPVAYDLVPANTDERQAALIGSSMCQGKRYLC